MKIKNISAQRAEIKRLGFSVAGISCNGHLLGISPSEILYTFDQDDWSNGVETNIYRRDAGFHPSDRVLPGLR